MERLFGVRVTETPVKYFLQRQVFSAKADQKKTRIPHTTCDVWVKSIYGLNIHVYLSLFLSTVHALCSRDAPLSL